MTAFSSRKNDFCSKMVFVGGQMVFVVGQMIFVVGQMVFVVGQIGLAYLSHFSL